MLIPLVSILSKEEQQEDPPEDTESSETDEVKITEEGHATEENVGVKGPMMTMRLGRNIVVTSQYLAVTKVSKRD